MGPSAETAAASKAIDDLIVCTRNRPGELRRCLHSVRQQTRLPRHILLVDGSDGHETQQLIEELNAAETFPEPVAYVRTTPGTARARNLGISLTRGPIIHFIDDDVWLDPEYFAGILQVFARDGASEVGGVSGVISNLSERGPNRIERWLLLDGVKSGAVLPSGRNVLVYAADRELEVEWLPGCTMSFRREPLERERFDSQLVGYSLGEDIDTSYRIGQRHRLLVTPNARVEHFMSPVGRLDFRARTQMEILNRYRRVQAGTGQLRLWAFWWSVLGQLVYFAGLTIVKASRHWALQTLATLSAITRILGQEIGSDARAAQRAARFGSPG